MRRWSRNREQQASHADDWLLTYADMITLLLCFFVIFIIVSSSKKAKQPIVSSAQIVHTVETSALPPAPAVSPPPLPEVFQGNLPFHAVDQTEDAEDAPPIEMKPQASPIEKVLPSIVTNEPPKVSDEVLAATMADIAKDLETKPSETFEKKGDRITSLEMNSAAFFDSGLAVLNDAGKTILVGITNQLKSDAFKDYRITVEGHTDDTVIHTLQFPSNWELSTARAAAVVRFFLDQGIPRERLRAAGYADTFPKVPNRDAAGNAISANQAQNRRVVIQLEKIDKSADSLNAVSR